VLFADVSDGHPHFDGLLCADGTIVKGSLLVLSCGVAARTELAAAAGLRVSAGIVVDEGLRSWTDDDVFAIGDCAQIVAPSSVGERELRDADARIPGAPSGLVGPGWRQASWLAARFADEALELPPAATLDAERVPVVMLKAEGVDAVAAGDVSPDVWDELDAACHAHGRRVAVWADPLAGRYVKTVTVGDRLTAFVSVGMPRAGAELTLLFEQGAPLPADRSLLLRLDGADAPVGGSAAMGPESVVCTCNGVTAGRIGEAAAAGCSTLDEVGRATRAGTGCGGCRDRVQALLDAALATAQP
jgi:assimilatory nitrate reductase electron transfer subunit